METAALAWKAATGGQETLTPTAWGRIQQAVEPEAGGAKVLPPQGALPDVVNVHSDIAKQVRDRGIQQVTVDEGNMTGVSEPQAPILLTPNQVKSEELRNGLTLSIRPANLLSQAQDLLLCQGPDAMKFKPLNSGLVQLRNGAPTPRLVGAAGEVVEVGPASRGPRLYGERTFEKVALAFGRLRARGFPRPHGLLLVRVPPRTDGGPCPTTTWSHGGF